MLLFARKKHLLRDDRLLQLILLMSLLRGSPDLLFDIGSPMNYMHEHDLQLGTSLGHTQFPPSQLAQELHPKSLDRMLDRYQMSVLQELNSLGNYGTRSPFGNNDLGQTLFRRDIQAYLLNAESSLSSVTQNHINEGGFGDSINAGTIEHEDISQGSVLSTDEDYIRGSSNDLFEDLDLLEAFWKQDVDLGISQDLFDSELQDEDEAMEMEDDSFSKLDLTKAAFGTISKQNDFGEEPFPGSDTTEIHKNKTWSALTNITVDSETGELLAVNSSAVEEDNPSTEVPSSVTSEFSSPVVVDDLTISSELLEFNLDEALKLVGLNSTSAAEDINEEKDIEDCEADSGCGDSAESDSGGEGGSGSDALDTLNDSLDEMIQASQLHPQHPRNFHGRLGGLVRTGGMEQRWQDLASLLSLPSPDAAHLAQSPPTLSMAPQGASTIHAHTHQPAPTPIHHPHALYPTHENHNAGPPGGVHVPRGVLIHNATLPPPMPDAHNLTYTNSMGASSHLVASSMNLTSNSDGASQDSHHYKMEGSTGVVSQEMMYYQSPGPEIQSTDGFLSSILNDEDLQLMDIPMNDYNGRPSGEYGNGSYRYLPHEDPHRLAPVAQKKHQMYGKRFFHDHSHVNVAPPNLGASSNNMSGGMPLGGNFSSHYPPTPGHPHMEGAAAMNTSEMKYSCTMDFRPAQDQVCSE